MRQIFIIIPVLFFLSCKNRQHKENPVSLDSAVIKNTIKADTTVQSFQYTLAQKLDFIDSVGLLKLQSIKDSISFDEESTFKSRLSIKHRLSKPDFIKLKNACKNGIVDLKSAKRIFQGFSDTTFLAGSSNENVLIELIPFDKDKNDFNEYAVSIGLTNGVSWSNTLYFFKKNNLISRHDIHHRYGLEIKYFKDHDGRTVIYYKENFGSGSGIWQFNYYFYKYYENKLIPVLNILQNGNYNWPGPRGYWLESVVVSENPLTIKFDYNFYFRDDSLITEILKDSAIVSFIYDDVHKAYIGNYKSSLINQDKILTYYLGDNELLFINTYSKEIKDWMGGKDNLKSQMTIKYLNEVMNYVQVSRH